MKSKHAVSVLYSLLLSTLLFLAALPAHATFPGVNGRIAFGRYNPAIDGWQLYTANPDGTDVQPLTFVSSGFSDWRADGKRIAFDFFDSDGNDANRHHQPRRIGHGADHFRVGDP